MDSLRDIRDLYRYNTAVRKSYIVVLTKLPNDELHRDRGASFPSLLDIFVHVLDAYRWWFEYAYRDRAVDYARKRGTVATMEGARELEEEEVDRMVTATLGLITPERLEGEFEYDHVPDLAVVADGTRERGSVRAMLLHMAEEELQHRGEMNALLWQMGVEPPIMGFDDWATGRS